MSYEDHLDEEHFLSSQLAKNWISPPLWIEIGESGVITDPIVTVNISKIFGSFFKYTLIIVRPKLFPINFKT